MFFDNIDQEDRRTVERIYVGLGSNFTTPNQLNWLERKIHEF